jgi:hypothetical protein
MDCRAGDVDGKVAVGIFEPDLSLGAGRHGAATGEPSRDSIVYFDRSPAEDDEPFTVELNALDAAAEPK